MRLTLLLCLSLSMISSFAQVGIDTEDPNQKLDVNGKIKIGNDGRTPTAGTIRYRSDLKEYQGYNGDEWLSFSTQANGPLPSQSIPVYAFENIISPGTTEQLLFRDWDGNVYNSIPANKMLILTGVYPSPNNAIISNQFYILNLTVYDSSNMLNSGTSLRISGYDNVSQSFSGDQAPLMVVKPGETLRVYNYTSSQLTMALSLRGFLVDDIDY